jgi:hypothetical protein
VVALAALAMPVAAQAQRYDDANIVRWTEPKVFADIALDVGQATGEFKHYVDAGIGLHGGVRFRPSASSVFGLRLSGNFMVYGSTTARYSNVIPGINIDVTTTNGFGGLTVGPEFNFGGAGPLQPYAYGGVGFSYFATTSSAEGSNNTSSPFANTTNFDDFTMASEGGAGLRVRLGRGRTPVYLDVGARYMNNGRVEYVTKDGLSVVNNQLVVNPITSEANLIVYHLGVSIGLRSKSNVGVGVGPGPGGNR